MRPLTPLPTDSVYFKLEQHSITSGRAPVPASLLSGEQEGVSGNQRCQPRDHFWRSCACISYTSTRGNRDVVKVPARAPEYPSDSGLLVA